MPSMSEMRYYIAQHPRYKGSKTWNRKCMTMPERQVAAIYNKFKELDYKALEAEKAEGAFVLPKTEDYHQIDMLEYLLSKGEKNDI